MHVLGFGTYDSARHPRPGIVLKGLADLGVEVTELNEPLRVSASDRVAIMKSPWRVPFLVVRILMCWARLCQSWLRLSRRWRGRAGNGGRHPDAVFVGYMAHFDVVLARALFPKTPIAVDMLIFGADTARDRGQPPGLTMLLIGALDRLAIRLADVVLIDTEENAQLIPPRHRHKAVVMPVGASDEWFASDGDTTDAPRAWPEGTSRSLSVIFFGLYTPLQGAPTIGSALAELRDTASVRVTMVGTGQDYEATRRLAGDGTNVTWVDWVPPDDLPTVVRQHDVCLGIFGVTEKARRVVPNKVFEGAAAGCVVITSDTAPQRRTLGASAIYVEPANPRALVRALRHLVHESDDRILRRKRLAGLADRSFRPRHVVVPLLAALEDIKRD